MQTSSDEDASSPMFRFGTRTLLVPTDESARQLLESSSYAGTRELMRGSLRKIRIGTEHALGEPLQRCTWLVALLLGLCASGLEEVAVVGFALSGAFFGAIGRTVRKLSLTDCVIGCEGAALRLRSLTHLTLTNVDLANGARWLPFIREASISSLLHLGLFYSSLGNWIDLDRTQAIRQLAPQLTSLALNDGQSWISEEDTITWVHFTSLISLFIVEPDSDLPSGSPYVANCLRSLTGSLGRLDISATTANCYVNTATRVTEAIDSGHLSVSNLDKLLLPWIDGLGVGMSDDDFTLITDADSVLCAAADSHEIEVKYLHPVHGPIVGEV